MILSGPQVMKIHRKHVSTVVHNRVTYTLMIQNQNMTLSVLGEEVFGSCLSTFD